MVAYLKEINIKGAFLEFWHRKEAVIWIIALVALAFTNPTNHHYTLCPFHNLGWDFCPGCGIGRSISYLFHLQFERSFLAHPMGIPAVVILVYRIIRVLIKPSIH
jgi:hypothetical protein